MIERLRRDIQDAHTALLAPTPDTSRKRAASFDQDTPTATSTTNTARDKVKRLKSTPHPSLHSLLAPLADDSHVLNNAQSVVDSSGSGLTADPWDVPMSSPSRGTSRSVQNSMPQREATIVDNNAFAAVATELGSNNPFRIEHHSGSTEPFSSLNFAPPFSVCVPSHSTSSANMAHFMRYEAGPSQDVLEPQISPQLMQRHKSSSPVYFPLSASQHSQHAQHNGSQSVPTPSSRTQEADMTAFHHDANSQRSTRERNKDGRRTTDPSHSDEIAIGLPQEMYQPRPSRSRTVQLNDEPDNTISVEVKRTKKQKTKRAPVNPAEPVVEVAGKADDEAHISLDEAAIVQVEHLPTAQPPAKKKRGRPKKTPTPAAPPEQGLESTSTEPQPHPPPQASPSTLTIIEASASEKGVGEDITKTATEPELASTTEPDPAGPPVEAIEDGGVAEAQVKVSTKQAKKQPSAVNKASVAFKVGLSKRARIEPLLRVIRK